MSILSAGFSITKYASKVGPFKLFKKYNIGFGLLFLINVIGISLNGYILGMSIGKSNCF